MLSLVAYGSSGESDSEGESEAAPPSKKICPPTEVSSNLSSFASSNGPEGGAKSSKFKTEIPTSTTDIASEEVDQNDQGTSSGLNLLSKLPAPKHHETPSLNLLREAKKDTLGKGPVKISIPALSDFPEDEDEPKSRKKIQPSAKGSGLFALLPPPQHGSVAPKQQLLVPHVLTRKPKPLPPAKKPPFKPVAPPSIKVDSDPESDEENSGADFFSLNKEDKLPDVPFPETTSVDAENMLGSNSIADFGEGKTYPHHSQFEYNKHQFPDQSHSESQLPIDATLEPQSKASEDFIPCSVEDLELDEEAIRRLCGRQGKRRREEMQIVDVSGDAIMPDQREWLTKQLTEEQPRHSSKSKLFGPSSQQRRKHQITYLAHVAKENELELKNSWANNRQTRKQTQSKYGF